MSKWVRVCALVFFVGGMLGLTGISANSAPTPIKIGQSYPLTMTPYYCEQMRWANGIFLKEIREAGGILGRPVEIIMEDSEGAPRPGIAAIQKLINQDKVDILMGDVYSTVVLVQLKLVKEAQIPYVINHATNPTIDQMMGVGSDKFGSNIWAFRINVNDEAQIKPYAKWIMSLGKYKIFSIVTKNDAFGRAIGELWQQLIPKGGGKIAGLHYNRGDQEDFTSIITQLIRENADALLVSTDGPALHAMFLNQAIGMGLVKPVYNVGGAVTSLLVDLVGKKHAAMNHTVSGYSATVETPVNEEYIKKFKNWPGNREHDLPIKAAAQQTVALQVIKEAIETARTTDKEAVRKALEGLELKDTLLGPIKFDENHRTHPNVFVISIKNGKIITLQTVVQQQP